MFDFDFIPAAKDYKIVNIVMELLKVMSGKFEQCVKEQSIY